MTFGLVEKSSRLLRRKTHSGSHARVVVQRLCQCWLLFHFGEREGGDTE